MAMLVLPAIFLWGPDAAAQGGRAQSRQVEKKADAVDSALRRRAATSLYRLKRALQRDRYPSALAALNIWRCNAQAAGEFDEDRYRAYQRQIYEKSVANILKWFEVCLKEKWIREAGYCQKIYRLHARAIDAFDQARYDEMTERIEKRKKEIEAEKKKHRTASRE